MHNSLPKSCACVHWISVGKCETVGNYETTRTWDWMEAHGGACHGGEVARLPGAGGGGGRGPTTHDPVHQVVHVLLRLRIRSLQNRKKIQSGDYNFLQKKCICKLPVDSV